MIAQQLPELAAMPLANAAVAQLRASGENFALFVERVLDDLDSQRTEVQQARRELDVSHRENTQRLAEIQVELSAARGELGRLHEQSLQTAAAESPEYEQQLREAHHERTQLRSELEAARCQVAQLAGLAVELAGARAELAEAKTELLRERDQSHDERADSDGDIVRRMTEMERERNVLEAELEAVRNRAAELVETLVVERRQMADERAEWSGEFRQLRKALERQSAGLAETAPEAPRQSSSRRGASAVPAPVAAAAESKAGRDPVLTNVMAQFEALQRDIKRRRAC